MKKGIHLFLFGIFFVMQSISLISASTIYGNVYGPDLSLLRYSIIQVNSSPIQNIVAINGNYSFDLPQGVYEIMAIYKSKTITLTTKEIIDVDSEGNFIHDLILFDTEDVENITFDETEVIDNTIEQSLAVPPTYLYFALAIFLFLLALVIYLIIKKRKKKILPAKIRERRKKKAIEQISESDETLNKIYSIIKKEKRITQKEIRKMIGMSEAKISLVIADLESRELVKKIKAGRGNIIVLNK